MGSNHGGRKFGPGAGAVSIGLAHRIAQHGPVVLALQVLYGEWENFIIYFDGSVPYSSF